MKSSIMEYDVVIRCRNEMEWLPRVINSIYAQTVHPSSIIIVDNGSGDGSREYAEEKGCNVIEYDKNEFNYSYALNLGIQETTKNEVLILSAHCELVTNMSVENMINARVSFNAAGVYGRQIPTIKSSAIDTRDLVTVFGRERIIYESYPFFHNAFSLIERSSWEACKFDENHNGIEDRVWAREQSLLGRKIVYEPDSIVFHEHGLNQGASIDRAIRVCENLRKLHKDDVFDWPNLDQN